MLREDWVYRRGDFYLANMNPFKGSEQGGVRPVVVLSNNVGNRKSTTLIVAPMTSKSVKRNLPTHVSLTRSFYGKEENVTIQLEQIRVIDKIRVEQYLGKLTREQMTKVEVAAMISLGLISEHVPELRRNAVKRFRGRRLRDGRFNTD